MLFSFSALINHRKKEFGEPMGRKNSKIWKKRRKLRHYPRISWENFHADVRRAAGTLPAFADKKAYRRGNRESSGGRQAIRRKRRGRFSIEKNPFRRVCGVPGGGGVHAGGKQEYNAEKAKFAQAGSMEAEDRIPRRKNT